MLADFAIELLTFHEVGLFEKGVGFEGKARAFHEVREVGVVIVVLRMQGRGQQVFLKVMLHFVFVWHITEALVGAARQENQSTDMVS